MKRQQQEPEYINPKNIQVRVFYYDQENQQNNQQHQTPSYGTSVTLKNRTQYPDHIKAYNNQTKQFILAFFMILAQILIATMNGIYLTPKNMNYIIYENYKMYTTFMPSPLISIPPMRDVSWNPLIISFASTLGLGLLFSYNKRLILSSLGFSLFINAYCLQYYPLINTLFNHMHVYNTFLGNNWSQNPFYLNQSMHPTFWWNANFQTNGFNTIEGCFRAAMAVNVAVSCVLGRVGLFEIFFTILVGTFGYELNRRLCRNFGDDVFGSMYIFAFGGFMGLAMGVILRLRDKNNATVRNPLLKGNKTTSTLSLLGAVILMLTIPFLAYRHYNTQTYSGKNLFLIYTPVFCLMFSASGGLISSITVSLIRGRSPTVKDFIHGPVAGMIIGGASSYFTANISYCIGVGLVGGVVQSMLENFAEPKFLRRRKVFTTTSFSLFGLQGLLGCGFAALGKVIMAANAPGLEYTSSVFAYNSGKLIAYGVVSSAIGFGFGLILGAIFYLISFQSDKGYFSDRFNWIIGSDIDAEYQRIRRPRLFRDKEYQERNESDSIISPKSVLSMPY